MPNQVWYHAGCMDGFGSAFAFYVIMDPDKKAKYVPVQYGDKIPEASTDDDIYILDFSFPPHDLYNLGLRVKSVTMIDHHETSKDYLYDVSEIGSESRISGHTDFPNITIHHDKLHSGAMLTWLMLTDDTGKSADILVYPNILRYVEDRDLWKFKLPNSREISAALASEKQDLDIWYKFAELLEIPHGKETIIAKGAIILARDNKHIWRQVFTALMGTLQTSSHGDFENVVICNASVMQSETGDQLLKKFPKAQFVALYWDNKLERIWSLRSRFPAKGAPDVSKIAELFGGGGHQAASGFKEAYPNKLIRILH